MIVWSRKCTLQPHQTGVQTLTGEVRFSHLGQSIEQTQTWLWVPTSSILEFEENTYKQVFPNSKKGLCKYDPITSTDT